MIHEHNCNGFIYQQELMESWQKHEYIEKLKHCLRFELLKINWTKQNYKAYNKYGFANRTTYKKMFYKYINEIDNIIRKLKIAYAYNEIERANKIKELTLKLIKQIK
jgi:hypothetical protein